MLYPIRACSILLTLYVIDYFGADGRVLTGKPILEALKPGNETMRRMKSPRERAAQQCKRYGYDGKPIYDQLLYGDVCWSLNAAGVRDLSKKIEEQEGKGEEKPRGGLPGLPLFDNYWNKQKNADGFYRIPYRYCDLIANSTLHTDMIGRTVATFNALTCLKFEPAAPGDVDIIEFCNNNNDGSCLSYVGRIGGVQSIELPNYCVNQVGIGIVAHEIMHALGFFHEHQRSDRDQYVRIIYENLASPDFATDYDKFRLGTVSFGSPYDTTSLMQYGSYAGSKNNTHAPTIVLAGEGERTFQTQRLTFSREDQIQINAMYQCGALRGVPETTTCQDARDFGRSYVGTAHVTRNGLECARWADLPAELTARFSPTLVTGANLQENYCRNFQSDRGGVWCFRSIDLAPYYCDVPFCEHPEVEIKWSAFGEWATCSETCGTGSQIRTRRCEDGEPGSESCPGLHYEQRECYAGVECGELEHWSMWSECDASCGEVAYRMRYKKCKDDFCSGDWAQIRDCIPKPCPRYESGGCLDTSRPRTSAKLDSYRGTMNYARGNHALVCKHWDQTDIWNRLSASQRVSFDVNNNYCRNPEGRMHPYCVTADGIRNSCAVPQCWSQARWEISDWSQCSVSCGSGFRFRVKDCKHGVKSDGACTGDAYETEVCTLAACPNIIPPHA